MKKKRPSSASHSEPVRWKINNIFVWSLNQRRLHSPQCGTRRAQKVKWNCLNRLTDDCFMMTSDTESSFDCCLPRRTANDRMQLYGESNYSKLVANYSRRYKYQMSLIDWLAFGLYSLRADCRLQRMQLIDRAAMQCWTEEEFHYWKWQNRIGISLIFPAGDSFSKYLSQLSCETGEDCSERFIWFPICTFPQCMPRLVGRISSSISNH